MIFWFFYFKNTHYPDEPLLNVNEKIDNSTLIDFEHSFVTVQSEMISELKTIIDIYESFIENVNTDDFKNKDEFFDLDFQTLTLSDKIKLTNKDVNIKIDTLDIRQTALLFDYLEKANVFLKYNNKDKAYFAHYLTGHAEQNLRTDSGFGIINAIRSDREKPIKFKDTKFYNLNTVKEQLSNIITIIDNDIAKMEEK